MSNSCDPMDCILPDSSLHGMLQARILEWVAVSFSRGPSRPRDRTQVSCVAGRFFTNRATREAPMIVVPLPEAQNDFREGRNKAGMSRGLYAGVFTRSSRGGGGE